jgi:parallel beta-helix repeat protein
MRSLVSQLKGILTMGMHSFRAKSKWARQIVVVALATTTMSTAGFFTVVDSQASVPSLSNAVDNFSRSVSSGLGNADAGGGYTLSYPGTANPFSVSAGAARVSPLTPGKAVSASLMQTQIADGDLTSTMGVPVIPTTAFGLYHALELRKQSDGSTYRGRVTVGNGGKLSVSFSRTLRSSETVLASKVIPGTLTGNESLMTEVSVSGTNPVILRTRAWLSGQSQPDWQLNYSDMSASRLTTAGGVGTWDYLSSSSAPISFVMRYFSAQSTSTAPPTPILPPPPVTAPGPTPGPDAQWGSATVGMTAYAIPANSIFVSPSGSDSNAGTESGPLKTVGKAISKAASGQTIELRGGIYHETIVLPNTKTLTIQSYPNEPVWFDGSVPVTGWSANGSRWSVGGWTTQFDASPTYTRGAPDNTSQYWAFVNPAYPMAAHPDQIWIDNIAQQQVASLAQVKAGTFYVDYGSKSMYLGSNPVGHAVTASTLVKAITTSGNGDTLRGFGVRKYAPSVPDMGAVVMGGVSSHIENVMITDSATTGLTIAASDSTVTHVSILRSGLMGFHADYADRLTMIGLDASDNNTEHFNMAPAAGGAKITRSRGVSVIGSRFDSNNGPGIWFDASAYNIQLARSSFTNNAQFGIALEISASVRIVNNLIANNRDSGIALKNTSNVEVWNNTIYMNARPINITQDTRLASQLNTYGHDARQPLPDPTVPWLSGPDQISNNVISGTSGNCLVCVEDFTHTRSASQQGITTSGNLYQRASGSAPSWFAIWARQGTDPAVYNSLSAFKQATGQDSASIELPFGSDAVSASGAPSSAVTSRVGAVAIALPTSIATLAGESPGTKYLGSWITR